VSDPISRLNAALEGRYRIERKLGEGGMATVYLADDLKHERKVALKVLKPELAAVVGADRFLTEIKTTAGLQHPHILPLHDSGEADGFLYYVMPYIEGETLRDRIDRERQLPVDEALGIATAVANALQTAHEAGVVHRDIKPANILMSRGQPLVADFGIALAVGAAGGGRLTETGLSVGTPYYMSPEQATGDQVIGPASDTYALACVLYEMLVGEPPYLGNTAQAVLGKIIQGVPVSATAVRKSIPANVDAAIRRGLEKLPADRFTDARGFARALADSSFRHGAVGEGEAVATSPGAWKWWAIATTASTLVLAGLYTTSLLREPPPRPIERFGAPFLESQVPTFLASAGYDLSPDGTMLAYRLNPGGGEQLLMLRRWDDLIATPVRETAGAGNPAISYDGLELAFTVNAEVKVLTLSGGPVRTLMAGDDPEWGPDGFVYAVGDSGAVRMPSVGGALEQVSRLAEGETRHEVFDVLPGGERALLVVEGTGSGSARIEGLDLVTGERRPIVQGERPRFAAPGHLVFEQEGTMMAARFDPGAMELLGTPIAIMEAGFWSISDDGKLFYTNSSTSAGSRRQPVWVTRDGGISPVEDAWTIGSGPSAMHGWAISPDGSAIAIREYTAQGFDIWVKRLGGPFSRITFGDADEWNPAWGPGDGDVSFLSDRGGETGVWVRRSDGTGEAIQVVEAPGVWQFDWTPDRTMLLLVADEDIFTYRPGADEAPVALVDGPFDEREPSVSPDGRWIAYTSDESGRREVYVQPFPDVGTGRWQVSLEGGHNPEWGHGGTELFFEALFPGSFIMSVAVRDGETFDPGTPRALFQAVGNGFQRSNPTGTVFRVGPDDQRFLFARTETALSVGAGADEDAEPPSVVLVNNFFEILRRMVPE
jgi:serine/threonine-protein kinase